MSAPDIDFIGILSETKRIINSHSRHFLALSVSFLLPLSFFLIAAPTSLLRHPTPIQTLLRLSFSSTTHPILLLLYFSAAAVLALSATSTITSSACHAFFGRPVNCLPSLLSLPSSLLPLLISAAPPAASVALPPLLLFPLLRSLPLALIAALPLSSAAALSLWALAPCVVLAERTWGLRPLSRSAFLLSGARPVAASLALSFSLAVAATLWLSTLDAVSALLFGSAWAFHVVQTAIASAATTALLLYAIAAYAVMYMYCKAAKGELAEEIAEEFARDYVCLPFDDQKMPHLVSIVATATEQARV